VIVRQFASTILALTLLACGDRTTISAEDETGGPPAGEQYSGCFDDDDCFDKWCLHPAGETGFCTFACNGGTTNCEPPYGGTATLTCLPVEGEEVCALDCGNGKDCPSGMRCEQIEASGDPRSICF
jgi:hypothetical protein